MINLNLIEDFITAAVTNDIETLDLIVADKLLVNIGSTTFTVRVAPTSVAPTHTLQVEVLDTSEEELQMEIFFMPVDAGDYIEDRIAA